MSPTYKLLVPQVQAVEIVPNPVCANTAYALRAAVTEIELVLTPVVKYCGTFYCGGEVI